MAAKLGALVDLRRQLQVDVVGYVFWFWSYSKYVGCVKSPRGNDGSTFVFVTWAQDGEIARCGEKAAKLGGERVLEFESSSVE